MGAPVGVLGAQQLCGIVIDRNAGHLKAIYSHFIHSWTWIGFIHGLDWIGSEVLSASLFFQRRKRLRLVFSFVRMNFFGFQAL